MKTRQELDKALRQQAAESGSGNIDLIMSYAETTAIIENCIIVLSDMRTHRSHIFSRAPCR